MTYRPTIHLKTALIRRFQIIARTSVCCLIQTVESEKNRPSKQPTRITLPSTTEETKGQSEADAETPVIQFPKQMVT